MTAVEALTKAQREALVAVTPEGVVRGMKTTLRALKGRGLVTQVHPPLGDPRGYWASMATVTEEGRKMATALEALEKMRTERGI